MRYLFCLVMLLALMLRAVPSAAWTGRAVREVAGKESAPGKGELPPGGEEIPADGQDDTDTEGSIEKEPFTRPLFVFGYAGPAFFSGPRVLYFPLTDSGRHLHHPDIHTPPPNCGR